MKASWIRASVVSFSFAAVGLLSLTSSKAADSTPTPESGTSTPSGGCCNINIPPPPAPPALKCGRGTKQVGGECVADTTVPAPAPASSH